MSNIFCQSKLFTFPNLRSNCLVNDLLCLKQLFYFIATINNKSYMSSCDQTSRSRSSSRRMYRKRRSTKPARTVSKQVTAIKRADFSGPRLRRFLFLKLLKFALVVTVCRFGAVQAHFADLRPPRMRSLGPRDLLVWSQLLV